MELSATVEIFKRGEATFDLAVEPEMAISALRQHLKDQADEVSVIEGIVGNMGVRLTNGKTLEEVLGSQVHILGRY